MRNRINSKRIKRERIRQRIRGKVSGCAECPRLAVFRSLNHIYAQVIDDESGSVVASASSLEKEGRALLSKKERSEFVGKTVATRLMGKGLSSVVFDRGGFMYHGRVAHLASAAREAGLKF
ncbi:MAG: 50S ribosomal protein L18 [Planctomycetes bacterium]|nr:50S ribosomal protein L18 [Planctomycetota bacterium]